MEVKVFDGENYIRTRRWYINFVFIYIFFIVLLFFTGNIVGVLIAFLFLGGYILFSLTSTAIITLQIFGEYLMIGRRKYNRSKVEGFVLELDQDETLKNIVFLIGNQKFIHSFEDNEENIKNFLYELGNYAVMTDGYEQSFLDKLVRILKL